MEDPEHYTPVKGLIEVGTNYRYIVDNLVDSAHVATVHHDTLACEPYARAKVELRIEGDTITGRQLCPAGKPGPIWEQIWTSVRGPLPGPMDHWAQSKWLPAAIITQETGMTPVGQPRAQGLGTLNCHLLTPESEQKTHYFWAICRDFALENVEFSEQMRLGAELAFRHQDAPMLTAMQETVGDRDFWGLKPCLIAEDVAVARVRRRMDEMLKGELATAAQA